MIKKIAGLSLTALLAAAFFPCGSAGQASSPRAAGEQTLKSETQEVLLDFVARDKHQKVITNLRPDEVQVYEDGVLEHLTSFRYRAGNAEANGDQHAPGSEYDPLRELNVVSIVFEGMSSQSRLRATQYALDFLSSGVGPNTWTGVFTLNYRLSVVQPYTNDIDLLRAAVHRAGTGQYQRFAEESAEILQHINGLQAGMSTSSAAQFQPLSPGSAEERGPVTGTGVAPILMKMEQDMLRTIYQQAGVRTIDGLRALVRAQAVLPGRKTVLYVSEGVVVPPERPELLRSIISEANQANVSFYTIDARGLQMGRSNVAAALAASSLSDGQPTTLTVNPGDASTGRGSQSGQEFDPTTLQTDPQANAAELARGTGGFAMDNGNDLRGPLHRVMEEVRAHYEVSYSPQSQILDGHFRSIEVKVLRPGIEVRSRKGYYAVPLLNGQPLTIYEMAAVRALNTRPLPHNIDFDFAALQLDRSNADAPYVLTFSVPAKAVRFVPASNHRLLVRLACVAIVKEMSPPNAAGAAAAPEKVIAKVSNDLPYSIPVDHRAEFEAGRITISLPLSVPPGRYHVEAALLDIEASTASAKKIPLIVNAASSQTGQTSLSDFVWVRSVTQKAARDAPADVSPLDTPYGVITPNLTEEFAANQSPAFFFRVFGVSKPPMARMMISTDGKLVQNIALELPSPAAQDASVSFLGQIPANSLKPGRYDVRLLVNTGPAQISKLSGLIITP